MFFSPQYYFNQQCDQTFMIPFYYSQPYYSTVMVPEIFSQNLQIFPKNSIPEPLRFIGFEDKSSGISLKCNQIKTEFASAPKKIFIDQSNDSQFSKPQKSKKQKSSIYKGKNTQTNLANQIFSHLYSAKSIPIIKKLFRGDLKKIDQFYSLMAKVKKSNKKYLNRKEILNFITLDCKSSYFRCYNKLKSCMQIEELRKVLRICVTYFLESGSRSIFLTSKKMNRQTLAEHLKKIRQFRQFINNSLKSQDRTL